jgi:ABC-type lipoprotein release transport system permease subunit
VTDLKLALRSLRATPVVSAVAALSLALGIGANTAIFSLSVWAAKFVATLLYGLEPRDAVTLVGAVVVLTAVGAAAGWLPAYRASRIDPAEVLRDS